MTSWKFSPAAGGRGRHGSSSPVGLLVVACAVLSILLGGNACHGMPTPDEESFSREVSVDLLDLDHPLVHSNG